jgi:hypothetical protein
MQPVCLWLYSSAELFEACVTWRAAATASVQCPESLEVLAGFQLGLEAFIDHPGQGTACAQGEDVNGVSNKHLCTRQQIAGKWPIHLERCSTPLLTIQRQKPAHQ